MVFKPVDSEAADSNASVLPACETQLALVTIAASSSRSQQMVVRAEAGFTEDTDDCNRQVNSSLDSALHDGDDDETVKAASDDGHSYAGTVVRGVLRADSE